MNFEAVLNELTAFFERQGCRFAIVGAFGLHAYGLSRATGDLDFIVDFACQDDLISFLEGLGYQTIYKSSGYSNHVHSLFEMGRLDFIYVEGNTADLLFSEIEYKFSIGNRKMPVPRPEHLIALKVLAIKNNPRRTFREMADIQFLMELPGIDENLVKKYFEKRNLLDLYYDIKAKSEISKRD